MAKQGKQSIGELAVLISAIALIIGLIADGADLVELVSVNPSDPQGTFVGKAFFFLLLTLYGPIALLAWMHARSLTSRKSQNAIAMMAGWAH
ncbi:MAG: hypothetical protein L0332_03260 [Chloroflexi bacterium]|nr:hypothetical protein [Chloroflexota bacterium]MCI0574964.1 hypothetical protein [Chloroflexota bacterium]MCI0645874.1 hypothetical protein [Chloroflexota bacterium]MCI0725729.1 hypothetical protein [Chloroflexota bacterium]